MIQVKSHKRTKKNGVSVVRKHMKRTMRKKVKAIYDRDMQAEKNDPNAMKGVSPKIKKSYRLRMAIMDASKGGYNKSHTIGGEHNSTMYKSRKKKK